MNHKGTCILGIDPGFATLGWAVLSHFNNAYTVHDYGVITTTPKDSFSHRLAYIHTELKKIIFTHKPNRAAVEQLFFAKNTTTAIHVAQARGVILLALEERKIKLYEYTPLQLKQATANYGRAQKGQVQRMMQTILKLEKPPTPDDAADALALAWLCAEDRS